jgi:hypothetical protein
MAHDFSYFDDFPEYFYYADLRTALTDLQISKSGIEQVRTKLPISGKEDRKALPHILLRMLADAQKPAKVIDMVWEHSVARFRGLGFSEKAIHEFSNEDPITSPGDRELLLTVLTVWLVRNESRVPRGYPAHMKQLWKNHQLEKHRSS